MQDSPSTTDWIGAIADVSASVIALLALVIAVVGAKAAYRQLDMLAENETRKHVALIAGWIGSHDSGRPSLFLSSSASVPFYNVCISIPSLRLQWSTPVLVPGTISTEAVTDQVWRELSDYVYGIVRSESWYESSEYDTISHGPASSAFQIENATKLVGSIVVKALQDGVDLTFSDPEGRHWRRNSLGNLDQLEIPERAGSTVEEPDLEFVDARARELVMAWAIRVRAS